MYRMPVLMHPMKTRALQTSCPMATGLVPEHVCEIVAVTVGEITTLAGHVM
jgi:hypothetical protein